MQKRAKGEKLKAKAIRQFQSGHWDQALASGRQALRILAADRELQRIMALSHFRLGRTKQARNLLQRLVEKNPRDVPAMLNLASIEKQNGCPEKAGHWLQQARQLEPGNPRIYFNEGNLYVEEARLTEARQCFSRAVELAPAHWQSWLNLGQVCKSLGDIEAAARCYRQALAHRPDCARAYLGLANLKRRFLDQDDATYLQYLAEHGSSEKNRIESAFALGEYFHTQNEPELAVRYWRQGNQCQHTHLLSNGLEWRKGKTPAELGLNAEDIRQAYDKRLAACSDESPAPVIFVTGIPRSGTTLVEQILASHSAVTGASELPFIPQLLHAAADNRSMKSIHHLWQKLEPDEWETWAKTYLDKTRRWQNHSFFTDKLPENLEYMGEILMLFPRTRIIVCQRTPQAIMLSNYRQLYASGRFWAYDIQSIAAYINDQLAWTQFWRRIFPHAIHCVSYEELVKQPQGAIDAMNDFLGLTGEPSQLEPHKQKRQIRTASAGQVTQPVHECSISLWKTYDKLLNLSAQAIKHGVIKNESHITKKS